MFFFFFFESFSRGITEKYCLAEYPLEYVSVFTELLVAIPAVILKVSL